MNYKELIENVKEIHDRHTIISGYLDLFLNEEMDNTAHIKAFDRFWVLIGKANEDSLQECFMNYDYEVDKEGCYQFDARSEI
jgi:hypothetical protein